ncbi:MAG: hypothetical protein U9R74_16300, partial [Pseudomonadota bacterium]|nr:hypothetical protein [Pseudomonadota bacterium]
MISRNMRLTVLAIVVGIALGLASSGLAASEIILHEAIDDFAAGNHSPPAESQKYPPGSGYNRVITLDQTQ